MLHKSTFAFITILVVFVLGFSPLAAQKANAQWVVADPALIAIQGSSLSKDFGLDSVAWIIANLVIERMSAATVNWINSGFKGTPAYVTDPTKYYSDLGNKIAGQYIFSNPNLNFLCGPISARVRLALAQNYINDNRIWQCKLTDAYGNMQDFLNDFDKGGWEKFFTMTQNPTQNPIGAYVLAQSELSAEIATRQGQKKEELSWGNGFLSFKNCARWEPVPQQTGLGTIVGDTVDPITGIPQDTLPADTRSALERSLTVDTPDGPLSLGNGSGQKCAEERIDTPGSVIQKKLNDVLNIGNDKLAVADEINEIVSALLNQLVSQVVGGIGRGLRGLSSPSVQNNNQAFTSQLVDRKPGDQVVDYFGSTTDTSILDVPVDPTSYGIDPSRLVYPQDVNGTNTATPTDNDCKNISPSTIRQMVEDSLGRTPTNQDIINFDCDPVGIH